VAVTESIDLLRSAAALLNAAKERPRAGAVDVQDVTTAERDLSNVRQVRIRPLAAWRTSLLMLLASLGRVGFWALDATQSLDPGTRQ
jgi:outer membrane protein TolC